MGYRITVTIDVGELLLMLGITDNSPTSLWFWMRTEAARGRLGGFDHVFFFSMADLPIDLLMICRWFTCVSHGDLMAPFHGKITRSTSGYNHLIVSLLKIHDFSDCDSIAFWWLPTAINWVVKSQPPKMQRDAFPLSARQMSGPSELSAVMDEWIRPA